MYKIRYISIFPNFFSLPHPQIPLNTSLQLYVLSFFAPQQLIKYNKWCPLVHGVQRHPPEHAYRRRMALPLQKLQTSNGSLVMSGTT